MSRAEWTDPVTIARAGAWLREATERSGRRLTGAIEQPHVRPWSTVFRAPTDRGAVFLKLCGPSQAYEPALTALLAHRAGDLVPDVIAVHRGEDWMLLADGGDRLRDILSGPALLDAWAELLPRYAELQIAFLGRHDELLACGTPDTRLDRLVPQLGAALADERILTPAAGAFGPAERERLRALLPRIAAECADLAAVGIGPTIQHDDLHDANVLRRAARTVIFDWGDSCVTHPFLSLGVALRFAAHRTGLAIDDPAIVRLKDAYLRPWSERSPGLPLAEAAELGLRLSRITRALCWFRVATRIPGVIETEPLVAGEYLAAVLHAFEAEDRGRVDP
ncbi:MAG TPA: phosphotransferase [Candidatus Limnocylindria bacterium]|nr:phosphotransferase [Candidatus Limnocylindria bacterium]